MPARNIYHGAVVRALTADGWTITDDPLAIPFGTRDVYIDLAAERGAVAAEKDGRRVAVEISSFLSPSPVRDLEVAIGQFAIYRVILAETDPTRVLFLAVPTRVQEEGILSERFGQVIVARLRVPLLVFDEATEKVVQWIS